MNGKTSQQVGCFLGEVISEDGFHSNPKGWWGNVANLLGRELRRQMRPLGDHIRGRSVAVLDLFQALFGDTGPWNGYLVADEPSLGAAGLWLRHHKIPHSVHGQQQLHHVDGWVNLTGSPVAAIHLRRSENRRVYPIVSVQHGLSIHSFLFERFLRIIASPHYRCDSFVCASPASQCALQVLLEHLAETFNREYGAHLRFRGRVDRIPLCIDTGHYRPREKSSARQEANLPLDAFILLYVGYFSLTKADLGVLIRVFMNLVAANKRQRLVLVLAGTGNDAYIRRLRDLVKEAGGITNIYIETDISEPRKLSLLNAADVFVSPSDSVQESFGVAPIEAMACGLPQIVADWDGYRATVVHDRTGFLVPTYWADCTHDLAAESYRHGWHFDHIAIGQSVVVDVDAFQRAIQTLIDNRDLLEEMGLRSRTRACQEFSRSAVAGQYGALMNELVDLSKRENVVPCTFDLPHYYGVFKHYATSALLDDWQVVSERTIRPSDRWLLDAEAPGTKLLDDRLLQEILSATDSVVSVGRVTSLLSGAKFTPANVRRHLMWLLKLGIIKLSGLS